METPVRGPDGFARYGDRPLEDFARSIELQTHAETTIPEIASSNHRGASNYAPYPLIDLEEGEGAVVTSGDGRISPRAR